MPTTPDLERPNKNRLLFGLLGVLAFLAIALLVLGVAIVLKDDPPASSSQVEELETLAESNQELLDIMLECTTPTPPGDPDRHECFEDAQARTQEAVQQIIDELKPPQP